MRAYLAARWRSSALQSEVDDALQDAFIECYRSGGALQRAKQGYRAGFRGFLFGVVRNVARRFEKRRKARSARILRALRILRLSASSALWVSRFSGSRADPDSGKPARCGRSRWRSAT